MGALEELVDAGKIRSLGVSNFDVAELEAARAALRRYPLACNQVMYHLRERAIERDVLPYCVRHRIALIGYSPFGHGDFPSDASRQGRALERVGRNHGPTARQVALAFLTRADGTFTIPKASGEAHVRENAIASDVTLTADDISAIDAAFPLSYSGQLPVM